MENHKDQIAQKLLDRNLISEEQFVAVKAWRSLGIFSLRNELLLLMYLGVLLFTSGVGIVIYKNIDTIGHVAILGVILLLTVACFYFSYKKSPGFDREETRFENPVFDYVALLGVMLACIFIGYLQFQYKTFGSDFSLSALVSSAIAFSAAYYFDSRTALTIAITGLAAFIGITATPQALLEASVYTSPGQTYSGIGLAVLLVLWTEYSEKASLKKHFSLVFLTFALHLAGICCIKGMFENWWLLFGLILGGFCFYFYRKSYEMKAVSIFVFTLVYGFIGFNILIGQLLSYANIDQLFEPLIFLSTPYLVGAIIGFIFLIKKFNKATDDSKTD